MKYHVTKTFQKLHFTSLLKIPCAIHTNNVNTRVHKAGIDMDLMRLQSLYQCVQN